jgi:hypothetical protein
LTPFYAVVDEGCVKMHLKTSPPPVPLWVLEFRND